MPMCDVSNYEKEEYPYYFFCLSVYSIVAFVDHKGLLGKHYFVLSYLLIININRVVTKFSVLTTNAYKTTEK